MAKKRTRNIDRMRQKPTMLSKEEQAEIRKALGLVAFAPADEPLDLTKSEKLRTTALMMAIDYVDKTICNDAAMYQALRADGKHLVPATTPHVLKSAAQFEAFLLGHFSQAEKQLSDDGSAPAPLVDAAEDPS